MIYTKAINNETTKNSFMYNVNKDQYHKQIFTLIIMITT